ncbi:MAG: class I SAM-dependent methyltransferase [Candidatus Pacearchaeota archaeon]|nr:class I SAM-dependent methyltransferase [Candidatus Pacearchaeota archaeon]
MATKTFRQFYTALGTAGLASLKSKERHEKELRDIKKSLGKRRTILDAGCGYGRVAIPLAKAGYKVYGLDITPSYIKEAIKRAKKEKVIIDFKVGNITNLPYPDESFDAVLCLWSVFIDILDEKDQLKAIKEIYRVLKKKGLAFIDLPCKTTSKGDYSFINKEKSIARYHIPNMPQMKPRLVYVYTKKSLKTLMKKAKIKKFKISEEPFGGRKRLIVKFWK